MDQLLGLYQLRKKTARKNIINKDCFAGFINTITNKTNV